MGHALKPLAKRVLIPLGLTEASTTNSVIHKKILGSIVPTLPISKEEMIDIMKIIKSLQESGLLIKGVSEAIKNEEKKKKNMVFSMLLSTLGASLLGNLLTGKGNLEQVKVQLEQLKGQLELAWIFNVASSFDKF